MATKKKAVKKATSIKKTVSIRLTLPQAERAYDFLNAVGIGSKGPQGLGGYEQMAQKEVDCGYDNRIDTILFDKLHTQLNK